MPSISASTTEVLTFLRDNDVQENILQAFESHGVDGVSLGLITEQDLREMGIAAIGHRKRLLYLSSLWRRSIGKRPNSVGLIRTINQQQPMNTKATSFTGALLASALDSDDNLHPLNCVDRTFFFPTINDPTVDDEPKPHLWKVFVSALYAFIVAGITSFVMVIAHERLPDMSKYPPLPDLFLDNLPHISWAFEAAEWVGVILMAVWIVILIFHRYRWILLRRFFALMGTVFLLRSITMLITSLSVPGRHLSEYCSPHVFANRSDRIARAMQIWFGFGMSTRGIHTCGDYMFSGHTTVLTLLNFFITEYAPRRLQMLHTASWVLNLFGVFFILASHEHYSIDVFVAVYVSSRLFLYYHCLANNRILHQEDKDRALIWFPMFSFLEFDVNGMIPNTYCLPFEGLFAAKGSKHPSKENDYTGAARSMSRANGDVKKSNGITKTSSPDRCDKTD